MSIPERCSIDPSVMLAREEYVEQAYFFRVLGERLLENIATQDLLGSIREEVLATTRLPMALDFMLSELKHSGTFSPAMRKLEHYFTPFQAYVIEEAEDERGTFDMRVAMEILRREAEYRAEQPTLQGLFLYQFESLCRNRLRYDRGLSAMSRDPIYDEDWKDWVLTVGGQIGIVGLGDLIYVRSEYYQNQQSRLGKATDDSAPPVLFGTQEGRIALANRRKDPLLLFSALHRQLGYPVVPKPIPIDESKQLIPLMVRRLERLEQRLKLVEEEQRGGIDLTRFMSNPERRASSEELSE